MTKGLLLVNKEEGSSSFDLIRILRKTLGEKKIGHCGTLDPFAKGLMILLVGRDYTKKASCFIGLSKCYSAQIRLGQTTDSYDKTGEITSTTSHIPSVEEIEEVIACFQGTIEQIPPMYSAKKVQGQKLYHLARKGIEIERKAQQVTVAIEGVSYHYPYLDCRVNCSSGTYIRSLAHDIGQELGCGAHLSDLVRLSIGKFSHMEALSQESLTDKECILDKLRVDATV